MDTDRGRKRGRGDEEDQVVPDDQFTSKNLRLESEEQDGRPISRETKPLYFGYSKFKGERDPNLFNGVPRYRDWPEWLQKKVKLIVKWKGRIPNDLLEGLQLPYKVMALSWRRKRRARMQARGFGAYKQLGRTFKDKAGNVIQNDDLASKEVDGRQIISKASLAFLQAYGSPFTDPKKFEGSLPRVPDSDHADSTVATWNGLQSTSVNRPGTNNQTSFLLKCVLPFQLHGFDYVGLDQFRMTDPTIQGNPAFSNYLACINTLTKRLGENQSLVNKDYRMQRASTGVRYVGSGIKMHDIGALESTAGLILGECLKPDFIKTVSKKIMKTIGDLGNDGKKLYMGYGLAGLFSYNDLDTISGLSSPLYLGLSSTNLASFLKSCVQECDINQDGQQEHFPLSSGITIRGATLKSSRPFKEVDDPEDMFDNNPNVVRPVFVPDIPTWFTDQSTDAQRTVYIREKFGDNLLVQIQNDVLSSHGVGVDQAWNSTCSWSVNMTSTGLRFLVLYLAYGNGTYGGHMLCNCVGIPVYLVDTVLCDNQCEQPFMSIMLEGVPNLRPLRVYTADFCERVVNQNKTDLSVSPSPQDPGFDDVYGVSRNFPVIVKGFTFFKTVWDGIKKAINFGVEHGSQIYTIGSTLASLL